MRYAEVYKDSEDHAWVTETWGYPRAVERHDFPTHEAALAYALAEVGLSPPNPEPTEAP